MEPEADAAGEDIVALPGRLDEQASNLLLAEFEHLGASLVSNEETGERRLNVFLTIIGASIAGLGLATDRLAGQHELAGAILVASVALLVYGLVVLRRIMERNVATTELLNGLRLIRAFFVRQQPELLRVLTLLPDPKPPRRRREPWWGLGKAGFLETLAATNCILAAVAAGASARLGELTWGPTLGIAVIAATAAWIAQMRWGQWTYAALDAKRAGARNATERWWRETGGSTSPAGDENEFFRAGVGLVVVDDRGRWLALERSGVRDAWQLPQGGLNRGESPEDAAWRELEEETGLSRRDVELDRALDVWIGYELPEEMRSAKTRRGQVHRWFLFRLRPDVELPPLPSHQGAEFQNRRWVTPSELIRGAVPFRRTVYARVAEWVDRTTKSAPESSSDASPK